MKPPAATPGPARGTTGRRRAALRPVRLAAFAAITALAVLGVQAAPAATGGTPARAATCAVPVVIDFGGARTPVQACSNVRPGSTSGTQALAAVASVQFAGNGLLCEIDRYPNGCTGDPTGAYWSYWHRCPTTGAWIYSSQGPGYAYTRSGWAEGWAYEAVGASRPPLGGREATSCPAPPPPPSAAPSPAAGTSAPPPGAGGTSVGPAGTHSPTATGPRPPAGPGAATTGRTAAHRKAGAGNPQPAGRSPAPASSTAAGRTQSPAPLALTSGRPPRPPGGPPVGALAGGALVAALGAAALLRARHRGAG